MNTQPIQPDDGTRVICYLPYEPPCVTSGPDIDVYPLWWYIRGLLTTAEYAHAHRGADRGSYLQVIGHPL